MNCNLIIFVTLKVWDNKSNGVVYLKKGSDNKPEGEDIRLILEYINKIKYGSVIVNIQDGKIVQIEKSEKIRL